jgi:outer membrane receptor for ferrienterochelin and colicins
MNRKRVFVIALSLLLLVAGLAAAQETGRIEGRVTREDGSGIRGVSVRIDQLDQVVLTDGQGSFAFSGVPAGTYDLTFSLLDYTDAQKGVQVAAGQTETVDKALDWDVSFAETITVMSASRREERITEAPAAVTVISQQEIEREAATGQVPKLLEFTPGVDFTQSGLYDFNFNARGFNSSLNRRILTLIDGRDPAVPFLGAQEWAAISFPMDELSSVELVRGPGSALYGANAFNGVLNMTTKAPRGSEGGQIRLTAGELNTRRGELRYARGLTDSLFFKIMGGFQQSDDFTVSRNQAVEYSVFCTATRTTDCLRREAVPLRLDEVKTNFGGLRFDKYFSEGASVLTLEGGTANLEGPTFLTGIGRVQTTDVKRPWTRLNFNTEHWNFLSYYDQRKAEDQVSLASGVGLFEDSSNLHGELQANAGFLGGKGFLVGGISYHEQEIDTANRQGIQTLMFEPRDENQEAAFGQLEYSFSDRLKAVVAARVDESTLHDTQVSPKAALVFSATPNHTFRLTYNEAFQVANYSEFFLRVQTVLPGSPISSLNLSAIENALKPLLGGTSLGFGNIPVLALGNKDLDVEKIKSTELGYSGIFGSKAYVTVDYYRGQIDDFITDLLPNVSAAGRQNQNFGPYAPPSSLPAPVQAAILNALRANLPPTLFPFLSNGPNGEPIVALASYANFGRVDTQGIDVGLNFYVTNGWLLDASYSWFDFDVKQKRAGDQLLPNAPENKASAGISYTGDRMGLSLKYRWVEGFPWAAGIFVGEVPSYDSVDLGATFRLTDHLELGVDVTNLLDDEHFQSFGGDLLSRRALGNLRFSW